MKRIFLLSCLAILLSSLTKAQTTGISGQIYDATDQPLTGAIVALLNPKDSSIVKGVSCDLFGNFTIDNVAPAKYLIKVSLIGYKDLFLVKKAGAKPLLLGKIVLKDKVKMLNAVSIEGKVPPTQMKGDTTQFNAGAFKTNPDANAGDLIAKMPGVNTQNEKVQAQGEDVKKVTVDGKSYFGEDPNTVLKNLPADVIDKIQIYDQRSDQSQFTGFDDGNTSKTMNIVTKNKFRNSIFGKVFAGYGYDNKWKGGVGVNFIKGDRRLTILGSTNNINEQNFSSEDLMGVMSNSQGRSSQRMPGGPGGPPPGSSSRDRSGPPPGGGSDASNFLVGQKNGITTTHSIGVNYVNKWKKVDFQGSYFFNYTKNTVENNVFRQYLTDPNVGLNYTETNTGTNENMNHRANFRIEWKLDTLTSFLIQPKFSLQLNKSNTELNGSNVRSDTTIGSLSSTTGADMTGINFSSPILFRHKFFKKGRTFSWNINPAYNSSSGKSSLKSLAAYINSLLNDTLDQKADKFSNSLNINSNITYTEPLGDASQIMFTLGTNYTRSYSNKETYDYSAASDAYNVFDTTLSNKFNTKYITQSAGTGYRYQKKKLNLNIGVSYQYSYLTGERQFPHEFNLDKTFHSVLPTAMLQYKFADKTNLRINYRSSNNAPSVSQLQDVIDNTNTLQLSTGNPNLKQEWQNSLFMRFSTANPTKNTSFFLMFAGSYISNYIGNSTFIASKDTVLDKNITLASGSQITSPLNLDGYYNFRAFSNISFLISALKLNLNVFIGMTYSHIPSIINGASNNAGSTGGNLGVSLASNISEKVDFTLSSFSNISNVSNSLRTDQNSKYLNQNSRFKIQVNPWKGLVLQTDLNHQYYTGLSSSYNQNYLLWNAAIGYKFLKNRLAEIRLSAYDILKQNSNISRNITETYIEDTRSNVMQRYFMLTFTYNIKYFKMNMPKNSKEN